MFEALRTARRQLDELGDVSSPLVKEAAAQLDKTLRSQPTWGKAAKNYADVSDEAVDVADTVSVNLREADARDVLDRRLDRARRLNAITGDKKLAAQLKRAERALEEADKVTGARVLGESTPDEIAKLQKQVDAFPKRAPKLAEDIRASQARLNKQLGGALGEMTEDGALDYVAARASGIGGKADAVRDMFVKAEKRIAAMKAAGEDPSKIARATAELSSFRKTVAEANEIPRAAKRIRDWEARPGKGLFGKAKDAVDADIDNVALDELTNALQPVLHGAGFTIGAHLGGPVGAAAGYLGGRALNKAFGERIARWVWQRGKKGAIEFVKKNPLEGVAAAAGGAVGGYAFGPKGAVAGAVAGQQAIKKARRVWGKAKGLAEPPASPPTGAPLGPKLGPKKPTLAQRAERWAKERHRELGEATATRAQKRAERDLATWRAQLDELTKEAEKSAERVASLNARLDATEDPSLRALREAARAQEAATSARGPGYRTGGSFKVQTGAVAEYPSLDKSIANDLLNPSKFDDEPSRLFWTSKGLGKQFALVKKTMQELDVVERAHVQFYLDAGHEVNGVLRKVRDGSPLDADSEAFISNLDAVLKKAQDAGAVAKGKIYRGVALTPADLAKYTPGAEIINDAFSSFTPLRRIAKEYAYPNWVGTQQTAGAKIPVIFEVATTRAVPVSPLESLQPRGATFEVVSSARKGDVVEVVLREKGTKAAPVNRLVELAKKDPGRALGLVLAPTGAIGAATSDDDQQTAGAAAASVGLLAFFLPKGGKKLLASRLEEAFGAVGPKARLGLRKTAEAVADENAELLRAFAKKESRFADAKDLLDEQFANAQRAYGKQHGIDPYEDDIPQEVLDALQADIEYRNAALIEADPAMHRLAEVGKFDVVKGEGKGAQGVPELRRLGLDEPGEAKVRFTDVPPVNVGMRNRDKSLLDQLIEASGGAPRGAPTITHTISPEHAASIRATRFNMAAEALAEGDMPQEVAQLMLDRTSAMEKAMPTGLGEGQLFGYVDVQLERFRAAAEKKLGRALNERELELSEAGFYHFGTQRHQELGRVDDAIAKDTARTESYVKQLGDVEAAEPDPSALMQGLSKESKKGWREAISEMRAELEEEGAGTLAHEDHFDEFIDRIRERHIVDPHDEIFIRKELGQEPPDFDIDDVIDDAINTNAGYHDYGTDSMELTADDIIRQIENGETQLGNHTLTPWEEFHIREKFDEHAVNYQERFDERVERMHEVSEAEWEHDNASDAKRRGLKRDRNEDGIRHTDDGLPQDWALESVGLKPDDVRVYDNAGIANVFGEDPLTMREVRGMFALDELRSFAKAEGSELVTKLEVDTDNVFFRGTAGGGSFEVMARLELPHGSVGKGDPLAHLTVTVPKGSGFTREGVAQRIRAALEARGITKIVGLGTGALAIGAGANALHDQAQQARDEVKAFRGQQGREEDLVAAIDKIDRVERTREKLGYLKTETEIIVRDTARAVANAHPRARVVSGVPGVTNNKGVGAFLGTHSTLRAAFDDKRQTLETLQRDPMTLVEELTEGLSELQETAPALHAKMVQQTYKVVEFLQSKLPGTVGASLTRPEGSPASPIAIRQFALYYSAATDPSSVMGDLANNRVQKEQIDTLRQIWPDIYTDLKLAMVDQLAKGRPTVAQRTRMDLLFDFGDALDRGLSNRLVAVLNQSRAQQGQQGGAEPGAGKQAPQRRTQPSIVGSSALAPLNVGPAAGPAMA
jgi:hypothetical protein